MRAGEGLGGGEGGLAEVLCGGECGLAEGLCGGKCGLALLSGACGGASGETYGSGNDAFVDVNFSTYGGMRAGRGT